MRTWRRSKSGACMRLEQHQHAEHALRAVHDGAGQDLVRHVGERPGRRARPVRRHRLAVQLRPADHVAVRARQDFGARARRRIVAGAADGDVLVRNQQRADGAAEVIDAALHELREIVRASRRRRLRPAPRRAAARGRGRARRGCAAGRRCSTGTTSSRSRHCNAGRSSPCTNVNGARFAARFTADHADAAEQ